MRRTGLGDRDTTLSWRDVLAPERYVATAHACREGGFPFQLRPIGFRSAAGFGRLVRDVSIGLLETGCQGVVIETCECEVDDAVRLVPG